MIRLFFTILLSLTLLPQMAWHAHAHAQEEQRCTIDDRDCVLQTLERAAAQIDQRAWRDQTYRELAKTYAVDGKIDKAIETIEKIESPDTKALTIRGIGMTVADISTDKAYLDMVFKRLRDVSEKITHPPSYAIALTYIAMSQAFAGDNEGAWKTASDMENDALRHKAFGETAEIQAEKGDFTAAMTSITFIESAAFRNKAYGHVSKILADHGKLQEAYDAAEAIDNAYKKAVAFQYILDTQKPREIQIDKTKTTNQMDDTP